MARTLLVLALAGLASACAPVPSATAPPAAPNPAPLMAVYDESIRQAAVKQPADVGVTLMPITVAEPEVVTWAYQLKTTSDGHGGSILTADTWVTQVPQLKQRCAGLTEPGLDLRMEQLLGMPPGDASQRKLFSFKAAGADIFRPCADPRISTPSCPASVPDGAHSPALDFVLNQMLTSYRTGFDQPGYPFTALGYTWDWKPDSETHHVGLSEYVVRKGAIIRDVQATATAAYCASP